jgi:hypothetical protein
LLAASWNQPGFGSHQGLHPGTSQDMIKFTKITASKFTEIHNSHASYDKIQHHHLTMKKCISQGRMQQYHKNSWTRRNAKIS